MKTKAELVANLPERLREGARQVTIYENLDDANRMLLYLAALYAEVAKLHGEQAARRIKLARLD